MFLRTPLPTLLHWESCFQHMNFGELIEAMHTVNGIRSDPKKQILKWYSGIGSLILLRHAQTTQEEMRISNPEYVEAHMCACDMQCSQFQTSVLRLRAMVISYYSCKSRYRLWPYYEALTGQQTSDILMVSDQMVNKAC